MVAWLTGITYCEFLRDTERHVTTFDFEKDSAVSLVTQKFATCIHPRLRIRRKYRSRNIRKRFTEIENSFA